MALLPIDTSSSVSPVVPAVTGKRAYIVSYELQGVTADNTLEFQNADDNSDIRTVQVSTSGGGVYWQEGAHTLGAARDGIAINLVFGSANRVVGSVEYVYR